VGVGDGAALLEHDEQLTIVEDGEVVVVEHAAHRIR
jgi:hypothetical protein